MDAMTGYISQMQSKRDALIAQNARSNEQIAIGVDEYDEILIKLNIRENQLEINQIDSNIANYLANKDFA